MTLFAIKICNIPRSTKKFVLYTNGLLTTGLSLNSPHGVRCSMFEHAVYCININY